MTNELDKLLAAAKAIWLGCGENEVGNLHRAITEFEAANVKAVNNQRALVRALARLVQRIDINGGIGEYKGGPAFVMEQARAALDPYDFENAGLRKEP